MLLEFQLLSNIFHFYNKTLIPFISENVLSNGTFVLVLTKPLEFCYEIDCPLASSIQTKYLCNLWCECTYFSSARKVISLFLKFNLHAFWILRYQLDFSWNLWLLFGILILMNLHYEKLQIWNGIQFTNHTI